MKVVGFTGSRVEPTKAQKKWLTSVILDLASDGVTTLHHGDCVGGDEFAGGAARMFGMKVVVHPPSNPRYRAFATGDEILREQPYRDRNKAIVAASDLMLALPSGEEGQQTYSGTWMTVRWAREHRVPVRICDPSGKES